MNINKTKTSFALMGGIILIALVVIALGFLSLNSSGGGILSIGNGDSVSSGYGGGTTLQSPPTMVSNSYRYYDTWDFIRDIVSSVGFWIFLIIVAALFFYWRNHIKKDNGVQIGIGIHIPPFTTLFSALLTLTLVILFARIWVDLEDLVSGSARAANPAEQLATLFAHMLFVLSLMVSSFLVYYVLHKTKNIYSVIVLPYLITSTVFSAGLLIETAIFALTKLGNGGVYIVLIFVVVVFTGLLALSQRWSKSDEKQINA